MDIILFFLTCFVSMCFASVRRNTFVVTVPFKLVNNEPIIGILSQETSYKLNKLYSNQYNSYIAASYVKFVEEGGARVVPIWIGKNDSYYEDIMNKINGVVLPGGNSCFNRTKGYADAGEIIYKIAKRLNKNGDYFPIFGICLGFELLSYLAANKIEHRTHCSSESQPLPLEFTPDYHKSKLFDSAPEEVIQILQSENVTANYHHLCITRRDIKKIKLNTKFRIMSLNHDLEGLEFISSIEHRYYPFYGTQFHPEKNTYEWVTGKNIPHGRNSTIASQYFSNFFVNEARKNLHKFESKREEMESLIYNYPVTYTGLKKSVFVQCYLFNTN